MLTIELPDEIVRRLQALALATGKSASVFAEEAILDFLDDLEDAKIAERRKADLMSGRSVAIPLSEIMKDHGLAD